MLILSFGAAPASAGPGSCKGLADESGQTVHVTLQVDQVGAITSREALWQMRSPGRDDPEGLSLEIGYVSGTPDSLGPPTSVSLNFVALRNPPNLAGAQGTLELSPGRTWTAPYQGFFGLGMVQLGVKTPWGGRLHPELVEAIEGAGRASATLRGRDGTVVASITVNPSDQAPRDRLFRQALAMAERRAAAAAPCT